MSEMFVEKIIGKEHLVRKRYALRMVLFPKKMYRKSCINLDNIINSSKMCDEDFSHAKISTPNFDVNVV